jgi:hypothetical protein
MGRTYGEERSGGWWVVPMERRGVERWVMSSTYGEERRGEEKWAMDST